MGKADDLRAELAVADAEEVLTTAKSTRPACPECGRVRSGSPKNEKAITSAKQELRELRSAQRRQREARANVV